MNSNQFPQTQKVKPKKYGLYEKNRLVMERVRERYADLMAEKKRMISQGIKSVNLEVKAIR